MKNYKDTFLFERRKKMGQKIEMSFIILNMGCEIEMY